MYLSLARKYRPQTFSDVIGQDAIVETLLNALRQGRIADAYLFSGTRGAGKTTLARLLAKALNCANPRGGEPCNECHFCKEISAGRHLDITEIDGASHRGIDDIRDLQDTLRYPPSEAKYKIIIIDEVHMLTKEAFNALLKTLEEPPAHVKFFLATTEVHKLPPTILSRCQRYQLQRIDLEKLVKRMEQILKKENLSYELPALYFIAELAAGSLRDALSLLDQIFGRSNEKISLEEVRSLFGFISRRKLFELDKALINDELSPLLTIASDLFQQGIDLKDWIAALADHYRIYLELLTHSKTDSFKSFEEWETEEYNSLLSQFSVGYCLDLIEKLLNWQKREFLQQQQKGYFELLHCDLMRSKGKLRLDQWLQLKIKEVALPQAPPNITVSAPPPEQPQKVVPLPKPEELETVMQHAAASKPIESAPVLQETAKQEIPEKERQAKEELDEKSKQRFETLLRFASVELEGIIKTKP